MSGPTGGRWPDFFLVGHHKSGTTAMYEMLRRHPQVFMPDLKEPRFLAPDLRARRPEGVRRRNPETAAEYLALFAGARREQLVGEASATYLFSHDAAATIAGVAPDARIVAILREPVSFLHSLHTTYLRIEFEDQRDLARALALQADRAAGRRVPPRAFIPQLLQYGEHVRYVEQLRRYETRFDDAQLLVLIYDDFRADNDAVIRRVLRFLGVDDAAAIPPLDANVTSSRQRAPRLQGALTSAALGRGGGWRLVNALATRLTTRPMRRAALRAAGRRLVVPGPPPLDAELAAQLRARFKPEVQALGEHLGRDLVALWGYDRFESS